MTITKDKLMVVRLELATLETELCNLPGLSEHLEMDLPYVMYKDVCS
jgi:hypothetical protein